MGYGIGISIRVAGNQTIFNVASSYSMSAEEHLEKIKTKCKQTDELDQNSTQTTRTQPKLNPNSTQTQPELDPNSYQGFAAIGW